MKSQILKNSNDQIVGIRITPAKGRKDKRPFNIPVVDVRNGDEARQKANSMAKGTNSRFIKPSFSGLGLSYNSSKKSFS